MTELLLEMLLPQIKMDDASRLPHVAPKCPPRCPDVPSTGGAISLMLHQITNNHFKKPDDNLYRSHPPGGDQCVLASFCVAHYHLSRLKAAASK